MKRVLSIILCIMMLGAVSALTFSAAAAEADDAVVAATEEIAVIGGIIRGSDTIIAVGDTLIKPYDRVAVFALPGAVKKVEKFFA